MAFRIVAKICGAGFFTRADTIAEAYERIRYILNNCGAYDFNKLSKYMFILCNMSGGGPLNYEDSYLIIEKL